MNLKDNTGVVLFKSDQTKLNRKYTFLKLTMASTVQLS